MPSDDGNFLVSRQQNGLGIELHIQGSRDGRQWMVWWRRPTETIPIVKVLAMRMFVCIYLNDYAHAG